MKKAPAGEPLKLKVGAKVATKPTGADSSRGGGAPCSSEPGKAEAAEVDQTTRQRVEGPKVPTASASRGRPDGVSPVPSRDKLSRPVSPTPSARPGTSRPPQSSSPTPTGSFKGPAAVPRSQSVGRAAVRRDAGVQQSPGRRSPAPTQRVHPAQSQTSPQRSTSAVRAMGMAKSAPVSRVHSARRTRPIPPSTPERQAAAMIAAKAPSSRTGSTDASTAAAHGAAPVTMADEASQCSFDVACTASDAELEVFGSDGVLGSLDCTPRAGSLRLAVPSADSPCEDLEQMTLSEISARLATLQVFARKRSNSLDLQDAERPLLAATQLGLQLVERSRKLETAMQRLASAGTSAGPSPGVRVLYQDGSKAVSAVPFMHSVVGEESMAAREKAEEPLRAEVRRLQEEMRRDRSTNALQLLEIQGRLQAAEAAARAAAVPAATAPATPQESTQSTPVQSGHGPVWKADPNGISGLSTSSASRLPVPFAERLAAAAPLPWHSVGQRVLSHPGTGVLLNGQAPVSGLSSPMLLSGQTTPVPFGVPSPSLPWGSSPAMALRPTIGTATITSATISAVPHDRQVQLSPQLAPPRSLQLMRSGGLSRSSPVLPMQPLTPAPLPVRTAGH